MTRLVVAALLILAMARPAAADFASAESAIRRGEHAAAYEACKEAAAQGDAECQNLVGVLFRQGLGVAANTEEAVRLFRLAVAKKLPSAEYNLGLAYLEGIGVPHDDAQAANWFAQAAGHGDLLGEYRLALLLFAGKGVAKDS